MKQKHLASIRIYCASTAKPKLDVPPADGTSFYTAGRMLSYWPQVNENGVAFFREDCQPVLSKLVGNTADIQHIKPGYDVHDPNIGFTNTIMGSIIEYYEDEEGIDILCKNEKDVAKAMGFTPDDFDPSKGNYAKFSEEADHNPLESTWIVVDKNAPTEIVKEVSYLDGMAQGYKRSRVGPDGKWNYFTVDGNPVYLRVKPLAFCGVGHVMQPADPSAEIYKIAASQESERMLSFYPGMDEGMNPSITMSDVGPVGSDRNVWAQDFLAHQDLINASTVDFTKEHSVDGTDADKVKASDDCYAAVWYGSKDEFADDKPSKTTVQKFRKFRVKNPKGDFDRNRLIAAYHALCGMRGDIMTANRIPESVRFHALALVRQGLNFTKPKSKENSSLNMDPKDLEDLKAKYEEILANQKTVSTKELAEVQAKLDAAIARAEAAEKEVGSVKETASTLEAQINEFKSRELSTSRLAELESIHPFKDEEKTEDFIKSLASVSNDGFENLKLRRELAKRDAEAVKARSVASRGNSSPAANPLPVFEGSESKKLSLADLAY